MHHANPMQLDRKHQRFPYGSLPAIAVIAAQGCLLHTVLHGTGFNRQDRVPNAVSISSCASRCHHLLLCCYQLCNRSCLYANLLCRGVEVHAVPAALPPDYSNVKHVPQSGRCVVRSRKTQVLLLLYCDTVITRSSKTAGSSGRCQGSCALQHVCVAAAAMSLQSIIMHTVGRGTKAVGVTGGDGVRMQCIGVCTACI
jgi:hypothetical protein